jgi:hypothetical protein
VLGRESTLGYLQRCCDARCHLDCCFVNVFWHPGIQVEWQHVYAPKVGHDGSCDLSNKYARDILVVGILGHLFYIDTV